MGPHDPQHPTYTAPLLAGLGLPFGQLPRLRSLECAFQNLISQVLLPLMGTLPVPDVVCVSFHTYIGCVLHSRSHQNLGSNHMLTTASRAAML